MKNHKIKKFKCKSKYCNKIKYIKLAIDEDEIKYNIDNINIHSSEVLSKEKILIGLILISSIFYIIY